MSLVVCVATRILYTYLVCPINLVSNINNFLNYLPESGAFFTDWTPSLPPTDLKVTVLPDGLSAILDWTPTGESCLFSIYWMSESDSGYRKLEVCTVLRHHSL